MFVENYLKQKDHEKILSRYKFNESTVEPTYEFWREYLFERAIRRFVWEGLPDTIPAHEIEVPLQIQGTVGITDKRDGKLIAYNGRWGGETTLYFDRYQDYSVYSPLWSEVLKNGTDTEMNVDGEVIVGLNDSLQNPTFPLCHRYATILSHLEVSMILGLINMRDGGSAPIAQDTESLKLLQQYRNDLCNGRFMPILDKAGSSIEFLSTSSSIPVTLTEMIEARENLLNAFYNDIGVRTVWNKKGNMIADEVGGNDAMLLQNVSDMLAQREKLAEDMNKKYGLSVSVKLAPELEYGDEQAQKEENTQEVNDDAEPV